MSEDQAPDIRVGHLQIRICGRSPVLDGLRDARAGAIVLSSSQRPDWDEFGSGTRSPVWAAVP